jgi:hypothetical protein
MNNTEIFPGKKHTSIIHQLTGRGVYHISDIPLHPRGAETGQWGWLFLPTNYTLKLLE